MSDNQKRLVIGVSGASGMIYALRFLRALPADYELHLMFSEVAAKIMKVETGWDPDKTGFADFWSQKYGAVPETKNLIIHRPDNHFAAVASGSFAVRGMVVIPCSVKTLGGIANGYAHTLIERAADVNLKERRPLVLVVRETPLSSIHLRNMLRLSDSGAVILPAAPGFYHNPQTIDDLVDFVVARVLNVLNIPQTLLRGWGERDA